MSLPSPSGEGISHHSIDECQCDVTYRHVGALPWPMGLVGLP